MFDPYKKWLGIAPKEQPANHYRLLGVNQFEDDLDVIEGAADKQMAFVRQYQSGDHAAAAAKILNELAVARLCLLKPATKAAYDGKLRKELAAAEPTPEAAFADLPFPDADLKSQRRKRSGKSKSPTMSPLLKTGIVTAVTVMLIFAFLFWPSGKQPPASKAVPSPVTLKSETPPKATEVAPLQPAVMVTEQVGLVRTWQGALGQSQFGVFSNDGNRLVYVKDNDVFIVDSATGGNEVKLSGHEKPVWLARFSSDDSRIVSIGLDETIRIWDTKRKKQVTQIKADTAESGSVLVTSKNMSTIAFSSARDRRLTVMNLGTMEVVKRFDLTDHEVWWRSVTPDLKWAISSGFRDQTSIWDLSTGDSFTVENGHHNYCGQFDHDGKHAMLAGGFTWDRWDFLPKSKLSEGRVTGGHIYAIATSPNTSRFMMGLSDGTVSLWDFTTGKGVMSLNGHEKPVGAVMMSPDNKLAISHDHSGVIILWRLPK